MARITSGISIPINLAIGREATIKSSPPLVQNLSAPETGKVVWAMSSCSTKSHRFDGSFSFVLKMRRQLLCRDFINDLRFTYDPKKSESCNCPSDQAAGY